MRKTGSRRGEGLSFNRIADFLLKTRDEVRLGATLARKRMEIHRLEKDREVFFARIGREVYRLREKGGMDEERLRPFAMKIESIEKKIAEVEGEMRALRGEKKDENPPLEKVRKRRSKRKAKGRVVKKMEAAARGQIEGGTSEHGPEDESALALASRLPEETGALPRPEGSEKT